MLEYIGAMGVLFQWKVIFHHIFKVYGINLSQVQLID